jgi:hypothetical protein
MSGGYFTNYFTNYFNIGTTSTGGHGSAEISEEIRRKREYEALRAKRLKEYRAQKQAQIAKAQVESTDLSDKLRISKEINRAAFDSLASINARLAAIEAQGIADAQLQRRQAEARHLVELEQQRQTEIARRLVEIETQIELERQEQLRAQTEETEAAQAMAMLMTQDWGTFIKPETEEEASALLMNMLMRVKH